MNISVSTVIYCPKAAVWKAIIDISHSADMISAIIDLEVIEQPEQGLVGLKWRETRKMFGKESSETMWVTECREEDYYCTRAENCGAIYNTRLSVTEMGGNTELTMSFSSSSDSMWVRLLSSVMGLLIRKSMIKMLEQDLADIKAFVEG